MARVTVEDCLEHVENRFELVMLATKRARHLVMSGDEPMVEWENDKPTVVALREISEQKVSTENIEELTKVETTEPVNAEASDSTPDESPDASAESTNTTVAEADAAEPVSVAADAPMPEEGTKDAGNTDNDADEAAAG